MSYHTFSRVLKKSMFLAGPGLLFGISAIAVLLKLLVFGDWEWLEVMLLGSILSATDPVAVVALLRELGVNPQLGTLIEGESLLNDGTAVVVFLVLIEAVRAGAWTIGWGELFWEFCRMSILGTLFGYAYGLVSLEFTSRVFNDAPVEIAVTLSSAYLVFYLAEEFHMSGILAVVALGVSYSKHGQTKISSEVQHFMHEFWEMLGYLANTLIFTITGVEVVAQSVAQNFGRFDHLFVCYCVCTVVRGTLMFGSLPLFKRMRYGFSWQEALVCTWGGLRGAIGLALGLVVLNTEGIRRDIREAIFFQVAGHSLARPTHSLTHSLDSPLSLTCSPHSLT
jgi:sodium/hydrogen exchanger 10/11